MNPSERLVAHVAGVHEQRDATSRSLTSHYERSSEWLTEAIQTCKRKILEGTGHEVAAEPKRLKKTVDKENVAVMNSKNVAKVEKEKAAVPASIKKKAREGDKPLPVMSMKVIQLRNELLQRGLDTTGLKKDLQRRLMEHIEAEERKKKQQESKSVLKSAVKAKAAASAKKDRDGDVRMKDADTSCDNMDVDEDASRRPDDEKKDAAKETTVAKSFLKSTAELFSPNKIAAKMHSSKESKEVAEIPIKVAKEANARPGATQSGRNSLTDGLKKTASAILSASPARKAPVAKPSKSPFAKGSAAKAKSVAKPQEAPVKEAPSDHSVEQSKSSESSSEPKNQSLNAAPVPAIPKQKLGSIDKNAGAATKAKRNKCTADRMARLAEIRGKSKPIASTSKSGAVKDLPVLSSSKALKLGSAKAKDSKNDRKLLLTAQMREKAAAGMKSHVPAEAKAPSSSKPVATKIASSSSKPVAPHHQQQSETARADATSATSSARPIVAASSQSQSAPKITASPKVVVQAKKAMASSSKKKKVAPRPDVLSPMSTYEMSDREQSDTDDSDSESHHHRQKKKVPKWAQKHNLLPALEKQYANLDGRLDPETIFPPVATCNLEDIFDQKKSRYKRRTSSANWSKDGVTVNEIVAYKRTMGY